LASQNNGISDENSAQQGLAAHRDPALIPKT